MRSSVPSRDTMEQKIKFGISNYLQLCVEAGFSQIIDYYTLPGIGNHAG